MASNDLFSYTQGQLISVIEQQHVEIQSLLNERSWLQEESNVQRSQVSECFEKVAEWQEYCKALEKEREHLTNRDEQWRGGLTKAVDELNTLKEKCSELERLCFPLKRETKKIRQALEWAFDLGKFMYEEYCVLNNNYTSLFNHVWTQGGWNVPLAICQGQDEGHPAPANPAEKSVPLTVKLTPEGWSAISPNMPTIQSPPKSRLFIRIQCPSDAFVGANANEKFPYMSAIQPRVLAIEAPCVSADNTPRVADNQTTCASEIKSPRVSTIGAPCVCEDKIPCVPDNQTPCVTDMKDPRVSGNQAPDSQVVCKSEKTEPESTGSAHLLVIESLPRKSTSKVS